MTTSKLLLPISTLKTSSNSLDEKQDKLLSTFFPKGIRMIGTIINFVNTISSSLAARLTMFVFSISISKPLRDKEKLFYSKGRRRKLRQGKYRFNVYEYGQGPKVLFVHGWTCNGARWRNYIDEIVSAGFTAVVMDAPAHGNSPGYCLPVPEYILCVEEVINAYQGVHSIVTHSMGSIVSTIGLSKSNYSNKRTKLVLMNTFADCDSLISRFATCIGIDDEVMEYTRTWISKYTYSPLKYFSMVKHFYNTNADILYICDAKDIVVPKIEIRKITSSIYPIKQMQTNGLGHKLKSDKVVCAVLDHIQS